MATEVGLLLCCIKCSIYPYICVADAHEACKVKPIVSLCSCELMHAYCVGNLACDIAAGSLIDDTMERLNALSTEQLDEPSIVVQHIKEAFVNCDEFILDEAYNLLKSKQAQNAVISVPGTNTSHTAAGRPQQPLQFSLRDLKSHVPATGRIPERAGSCAVVANVVKDHLYLSHVG